MDGSGLRLRPVALALLCLAVLAFAAATLDTATDPESGLGFGSPSTAPDVGNPDTPEPTPDDAGSDEEGRPSIIDADGGTPIDLCHQWLTQTHVQLAILGGLAALFSIVRWRKDAAVAFAVTFVVAYPGLFIYMLLTACGSRRGLLPLSSRGDSVEEGGGLIGGESAVTSPDLPAFVLLLLTVAGLVAVAAVVLTGDDERPNPDDGADDERPPAEPEADVAAVGRAAGRAADRIERSDEFENEVYRAWAEMTEPLSVDRPESSTPAEFASAAVEAGMEPEDVDRLTALFEEVRYGGADPTDEREREAVATLRRIEAAYAGDEP